MKLNIIKKKNSFLSPPPFDYNELKKISFGKQQGEQDEILKDNFIITDSIKQFLNGSFNYVLSPKGFGKSALFKVIEKKYLPERQFNYNNKIMLFVNQAFGFDDDYLDPKKFKLTTLNKDYVFAWAIFLLNKILIEIVDNYSDKQGYDELIKHISRYEELKEEHELYSLFEKIEKWNISLAFDISGQQIKISPKVGSKKSQRKIRLNSVFTEINKFLVNNKLKLELYIDRIDRFVANTEYGLQKKYIQGLFDTVEEISQLPNINVVLFLRTDLFYSMEITYEHDKIRD